MCAGKKQQKQETVTVVTASTMQYLTQHPNTQKEGRCSESLSVVNSCRETPGPIPNPEAKPAHADGTATGRLWESKSPPTPNNNTKLNTNNKEEDGIPPPSSLRFTNPPSWWKASISKRVGWYWFSLRGHPACFIGATRGRIVRQTF